MGLSEVREEGGCLKTSAEFSYFIFPISGEAEEEQFFWRVGKPVEEVKKWYPEPGPTT
jgi:hypothetical protein